MGSLRSLVHNPLAQKNRLDSWSVCLSTLMKAHLREVFPNLSFRVTPQLRGEKEFIVGNWMPVSGEVDTPRERQILDSVVNYIRGFAPPDNKKRLVSVRADVTFDESSHLVSGTFYIE